ncbi:MAG: hypothetical protein HRF49_11375 [bacterium]
MSDDSTFTSGVRRTAGFLAAAVFLIMAVLPAAAAQYYVYYQVPGGIARFSYPVMESQTVLSLGDKKSTLEDFDISVDGGRIVGIYKGNVVLYDRVTKTLVRLTEDGGTRPRTELSYECPRFAGSTLKVGFISRDPVANPPLDGVWIESLDGSYKERITLQSLPKGEKPDRILFNPSGDALAIGIKSQDSDTVGLAVYSLKTKKTAILVGIREYWETYFGESVEDFVWLDSRQLLVLVSDSSMGGFPEFRAVLMDVDTPGKQTSWTVTYKTSGEWIVSVPKPAGGAYYWMRLGAPDGDADKGVFVQTYKARLFAPNPTLVGEFFITMDRFDKVEDLIPFHDAAAVAVFYAPANPSKGSLTVEFLDHIDGSKYFELDGLAGTRLVLTAES